jgi:hypothetical protein
MGTLEEVKNWVAAHPAIKIDGIYNSTSIWVDRNGRYFVHNADRTSATWDKTSPTPLIPERNSPSVD